jgi:hypothetical protein
MKKLLIGSLLFLTACGAYQYKKVAIYCPSAPTIEIDSVYSIAMYKTAVYVDYRKNGELYTIANSPSCTVRALYVYPTDSK